jgi:hypothetical protein
LTQTQSTEIKVNVTAGGEFVELELCGTAF